MEPEQPLVGRHFCRPFDPVHLHGTTKVSVLAVVPIALRFEKTAVYKKTEDRITCSETEKNVRPLRWPADYSRRSVPT